MVLVVKILLPRVRLMCSEFNFRVEAAGCRDLGVHVVCFLREWPLVGVFAGVCVLGFVSSGAARAFGQFRVSGLAGGIGI